MNQEQLLAAFGGVKDEFVLELDNACPAGKITWRGKRLGLIAAIVALMVLLMGSAVVLLRLQDLSIGKVTITQKYDAEGHSVAPTEEILDVMTLYGRQDSPVGLAAKQWQDYLDACEMPHTAEEQEISEPYASVYQCYSQEMVKKLEGIAEENNLQLLSGGVAFQRWQSDAALDAMGIKGVFQENGQVDAEPVSGVAYLPGNAFFDVSFTLMGDAAWGKKVSGRVYYTRKDYMATPSSFALDIADYEQWTYTTAAGQKLLLALGNQGSGYIVADTGEATIGIGLHISTKRPVDADWEAPSREVLEQLAEVFDYNIRPEIRDVDALTDALEQADAEYEAQLAAAETIPPAQVQPQSEEALKAEYVRQAGVLIEKYNYCRYSLRDINADGILDLLVSSDELADIDPISADYYWSAYTIIDGELRKLSVSDIYLCENGIVESYHWQPGADGIVETHEFFRLDGPDETRLDHLVYYRATDTWVNGLDDSALSREEAEEILAKYPRIDQGMRPISELLGG